MAPATKNKSFNKSDFIKSMAANKAELATASKTKRQTFGDDGDIIEKLDLQPGEKQTHSGNLAKVSFGHAKGDKKKPYCQFFYVLDDGTNLPGKYFKLHADKGKTAAENSSRMFHEFQALGIDTSKWGANAVAKAVDVGLDLTKETPEVKLSLSVWGDNDDRLGIDVLKMINEDEEYDSYDEDDEEDAEEDSSVEDEAGEEEESAEDSSDGEDPSENVGYEVTFRVGRKSYTGAITEYDSDDDSYTIQDEDENEHQISTDKVEFVTE